MARLIDADAFEEEARNRLDMQDLYLPIHIKEFVIDDMPTINAVPVKHGKWIWKGEEGDSRFMCSVCKWKENVPTCNGVPDIWQYCPSCGARMDGE